MSDSDPDPDEATRSWAERHTSLLFGLLTLGMLALVSAVNC